MKRSQTNKSEKISLFFLPKFLGRKKLNLIHFITIINQNQKNEIENRLLEWANLFIKIVHSKPMGKMTAIKQRN